MWALTVITASLLFAPDAWAAEKYKVLHAFTGGSDGGGLYGGVILDERGNVYGTTSGGGAYGEGTVFRLRTSPNGRWAETVLHSFCSQSHCTDGALPPTGLALDAAQNLYGTAGGGVQNSGVIFELSPPDQPTGWSFQVLFDASSGSSLTLDQTGNLYGSIGPGKYGKGAATELSPGSDGWTETYLYSFCPKPLLHCLDGDDPDSPLTWDASGNLYGTTLDAGRDSLGVVYQLEHTSSGWKEHVLHNFPAFSTDGYHPGGGLTLDQKGNVYGATSQGGGKGSGMVFELIRGADGRWNETILYDFSDASKNGGGPMGGVIFDRFGNLYGTASGGGDPACRCGVVFELTPGASGKWTYSVLHRFTGADGFDPEAGMTLDSKGNLFGTTVAGGAGGYGVVFEITP
jgi:uncharacterized repeat protein (TIGR03803 family)